MRLFCYKNKKDIIYKYISCDDALKTIDNNSVALNNPLNYNDPFDCIIDFKVADENKTIDLLIEVIFLKEIIKVINDKDLKFKWNQKIIIYYYKKILKLTLWCAKKQKYYESNPGFRILFKSFIKTLSRNNDKICDALEGNKIKFLNEVLPQIKEIRNSSLVSCFSKKNDSILLWSHYGDKHKGVCIGFERPEKNFYDVEYRKERTEFPLYELTCIVSSYMLTDSKIDFDDQNIIIKGMKTFLTKSKEWSYEEEVRCVFSTENEEEFKSIGNGKYLYTMPTAIKKIYLGCKISEENKEKITKIAKEKNIKVYQFVESSDKYKLIIK